MKSNRVMAVCFLVSTGMHAMETGALSYNFQNTTIRLIKGSVHDAADSRVDLMVVGKNEQLMLSGALNRDNCCIGDMCYAQDNIVYKKNDDDESTSDDDEYKSFDYVYEKKLWEKAHKQVMPCHVMRITEPCIIKKLYWDVKKNQNIEGFVYSSIKQNSRNIIISSGPLYGKEAVSRAKKDLYSCYSSALAAGLNRIEEQDKKIALSSLSTAIGFPREEAGLVAVWAVLNFIIKNPGTYSAIELLVRKESELFLYKMFLRQYAQER